MDSIGRLTGLYWLARQTLSAMRHLKRILRTAGGMAILLGLALAAQGCFNTSPQSSALAYGGPAEYANYGYSNDPFAFASYDPFLYSYWYPPPFYYYSNYQGDGDHDCDDGFCGHRSGNNAQPPRFPRSLAARAPNPERSTAADATSNGPTHWLSAGNPSAEGYRSGIAPAHGFSGGRFGGGGFRGGGGHGSSHR